MNSLTVRRFASPRLEGAEIEVLAFGNDVWIKLTNEKLAGFLAYWSRECTDTTEALDLVQRLRDELTRRLDQLTSSSLEVRWREASRLWFDGWELWPYDPIPLREVLDEREHEHARREATIEDLDAL